jgi:hypothetical protein
MKANFWRNSIGWGSTALMRTLVFVGGLGVVNAIFQAGRAFTVPREISWDFLNVQSVNVPAIFDFAFGLFAIVIPLALSWYARTYLKSAESQKRIGVITSLANAAINYAEDCDRRGQLELLAHGLELPESLSHNPSPGNQKLALASHWLVEELKKMGIRRVNQDQAMRWVAAEFQRNMGDLQSMHSVSALTDLAADLLKQLGRNGYVKLPSNTLDAVSLIQFIADWAAAQSGDVKYDKVIQREAAMARISPSSLMMSAGGNQTASKISPEVRITLLARRATEFVAELQKQGKLRMPERETAKAWVVQQAQLDDIPVTSEQIDSALTKAFDHKPV